MENLRWCRAARKVRPQRTEYTGSQICCQVGHWLARRLRAEDTYSHNIEYYHYRPTTHSPVTNRFDTRQEIYVLETVTREEMQVLETETREEMQVLETVTREEMQVLETETREEMQVLETETREEMQVLETETREEMQVLETEER